MKIRKQDDRVIKKGVCFIEEFDKCQTSFGEGTVHRIWIKEPSKKDEELLGYRVQAGYRSIWGDICVSLKDAIDTYESKEKSVRKKIKDVAVEVL